MNPKFYLFILGICFYCKLFSHPYLGKVIFHSNHHITIKGSVLIQVSKHILFDFVSHFQNDALWRNEINKTIIAKDSNRTEFDFTEFTKLSKSHPNHSLNFKIIHQINDSEVIAETINGSEFWVRSIRRVIQIDANKSKFEYEIGFDDKILQFALGYRIPDFILKPYLIRVTKKYLKNLRLVLSPS